MEKEAMYYEKLGDNKVQCHLCPHNCIISPDRVGICRVRMNRDGKLNTMIYGEVSSLAMDPIEKKPLYHFYPGSYIFSIGTVGCSFRCKFCQNYSISQNPNHPTDYYSPEKVVQLALQNHSIGVAYTYTEPLIWFEYVLDTCKIARDAGLKNVFVTNGYITREPLLELLPLADAFNIDLKSSDEGFYRKIIFGKLKPVLDTIEEVSKWGQVVLEVTTLVIPGSNDSDEEMERHTAFLSSLNPNIPYHLSAYYPIYQFDAPPTPTETLERLKKIALKKMNYVYLGNVSGAGNTNCWNCGSTLIERYGYHIVIKSFDGGKCKKCGKDVPIVG